MPAEQFIFVGYEVTEVMRAEFAAAPAKHRVYLDNPAFLETAEIEGAVYVGKKAEASAAIDHIEDVARNVVSLLGRLAPSAGVKAADALVLGVEAQGLSTPPTSGDDGQGSQDPDFEYADLVD
jgi:hypothetical protein